VNQEQWLGIGRALLAWIGGVAIGHGFVTDNAWSLIAGVLSTTWIAAYAFFVVHDLTLDAVMGVTRAAIAAGGGWLQFKGIASASDVEQFSSFALLAVPAIWSAYAHRVSGLSPRIQNSAAARFRVPPGAPSIALAFISLPMLLGLGGCSTTALTAGSVGAAAAVTSVSGAPGVIAAAVSAAATPTPPAATAALNTTCAYYPAADLAFHALAKEKGLSAQMVTEEEAAVAGLQAICASPPENLAGALKDAGAAYSAVMQSLAKAHAAPPPGS
jgi:hypothetical protein